MKINAVKMNAMLLTVVFGFATLVKADVAQEVATKSAVETVKAFMSKVAGQVSEKASSVVTSSGEVVNKVASAVGETVNSASDSIVKVGDKVVDAVVTQGSAVKTYVQGKLPESAVIAKKATALKEAAVSFAGNKHVKTTAYVAAGVVATYAAYKVAQKVCATVCGCDEPQENEYPCCP